MLPHVVDTKKHEQQCKLDRREEDIPEFWKSGRGM